MPNAERGFVLRDAVDEDRDAMRDLTLRAYSEYATIMNPDAWSALEGAIRAALGSETGAQRIVADDDGTLIGSVMLYPASANAYGEYTGQLSAPELRLLAVAEE